VSGDSIFELYRDDDGETRARRRDGIFRCDFCTTPNPRWEYPMQAGVIELDTGTPVGGSDDEFAACDRCHGFIEADDYPGLVRYSVRKEREVLPVGTRVAGGTIDYPPIKVHEQMKMTNVMRFKLARNGPARPWRDPE
jgi:hypothetical protein